MYKNGTGSLEVLLATLSPKNQKNVSEFLSISTFGAKPKHKRLFDALMSSADLRLSENDLVTIFSSKRIKDVEVRLLKSELKKLIEKYIDFKDLENDDVSRNLRLLKYYKHQGVDKLYHQKISFLDKYFARPTHDQDRKKKIEFELEKLSSLLSQSRDKGLNLQTILDEMDAAYIGDKLKHVCLALSHQTVYKAEYSFALLDEIIKYVENHDILEVPYVSAYYHCFHMLNGADDVHHFRQYIEIIQKDRLHFTTQDLSSLYRLAINFCIKQLNSGDKSYLQEGLELYKLAIEEGYFIENGYLSRFTYRNVAMMAIRSDQYEWAATFSERFAQALRPKYKESAYLFNIALIHFHSKAYNEALDSLMRIRIKDPLINLSIKALQLKIYYNLDNIELLLSHLDAMQVYIHRNKVLGYHKHNYLNIVKYGKKLVKLKYGSADKKKITLDRIQSEKHLSERKWFVEQVMHS